MKNIPSLRSLTGYIIVFLAAIGSESQRANANPSQIIVEDGIGWGPAKVGSKIADLRNAWGQQEETAQTKDGELSVWRSRGISATSGSDGVIYSVAFGTTSGATLKSGIGIGTSVDKWYRPGDTPEWTSPPFPGTKSTETYVRPQDGFTFWINQFEGKKPVIAFIVSSPKRPLPEITTAGIKITLDRQLHGEFENARFISNFAAVLSLERKRHSTDGLCRIWDATTGKEIISGKTASGPNTISLDGKTFFVAAKQEVFRYSLPDLKLLGSVSVDKEIDHLIATQRGVFACFGRELYDATTGRLLRTFGHAVDDEEFINLLTVSPDGRLAAAVGWENIHLWNVDDQALLLKAPRIKDAQGPFGLAFMPDAGALIETMDGGVEVLKFSDRVTTRPQGDVAGDGCGHGISIGLDVAANGSWFATQSGKQLMIGDCATLGWVGRICFPSKVLSLSFSSDGKMLLVSSHDEAFIFNVERATQ